MRKRASKVCWPDAAWSSKTTLRLAHACTCKTNVQGLSHNQQKSGRCCRHTVSVFFIDSLQAEDWQRHFVLRPICLPVNLSDGQHLHSSVMPGIDIKHLKALWAISTSCSMYAPHAGSSAAVL